MTRVRHLSPLFLLVCLLAPAQTVRGPGAHTDPARAEKAFAAGQAAAQSKLWTEALEAFTTAILYKESFADAFRARAHAYIALHRDADAVNDLTSLLAAAPNDGEALGLRGLLHAAAGRKQPARADLEAARAAGYKTAPVLAARAHLAEGDLALPALAEAIAANPADPALPRERALIRLSRQEFSEALPDLSQSLTLDPKQPDLLIERGFAHGQLGDFAMAVTDLAKAIELQPANPRAWFLRGEAYRRLSKGTEAAADLSRAIELAPEDANFRLARAAAYVTIDRVADALADRTEAIRLQPNNPRAYIARGGSFHMLNRHPEGFADRTKAIEMAPELPEAWLARGSAYYLTGDFEKAVSDLERARRLAPRNTEIQGVLTSARAKLEEKRNPPVVAVAKPPEPPKPAPEPPTKAPEPPQITAKSAAELHDEARRLASANDFKAALPLFTQALEKNPRLALAWNGRGYAQMRLANYKAAIDDFTEAIKLNPNYANAYRNRSAAFRAAGNAAMSAEDAEMAAALTEKR